MSTGSAGRYRAGETSRRRHTRTAGVLRRQRGAAGNVRRHRTRRHRTLLTEMVLTGRVLTRGVLTRSVLTRSVLAGRV
ncbi:hypothetical protein [Actinoplanes sp. NPDC023714]|uniref:hypothetical protein n=1 Tax=Actinoplanes sp. NPDC023714 TaxID=3154322 RepID=UPI0033F7EE5D